MGKEGATTKLLRPAGQGGIGHVAPNAAVVRYSFTSLSSSKGDGGVLATSPNRCTIPSAMPTPFTHLALAEEVLQSDGLSPTASSLLLRQRGPFLLGNTAPDVQTVSGQSRIESHFYTLPRTTDRPAHETLFAAHPALTRPTGLPPMRAAFVAGYITHLLLDELWLDDIFLRYFAEDWASRRQRAFIHNVLRTWVDRQDQQRLNGTVAAALHKANPQGWLPFVDDESLRAWRDWLIEQLGPDQNTQTTKVFAQRMGVSATEMETLLASTDEMEMQVFCRVPRVALQSFHDAGYARSIALINWYLDQ